MYTKVSRFKADESGAITADYVVLAGAIIALALSAVNAVRLGTFDGMLDIVAAVESASDGCVKTTEGGGTDLSACE